MSKYEILFLDHKKCYNAAMESNSEIERKAILLNYSQGNSGTQETIAKLGLSNYGELLIELGKYELGLPKPTMPPAYIAQAEKVASILKPLLLQNGK